MRLARAGLICIAVVVVAGAIPTGIVAYDVVQFYQQPLLTEGETRQLNIPDNTSWKNVAERAADADVVDSALYFDLWGRYTGLAEEARAGAYHLQGPLSLEEFADVLRKGGRADEMIVTLPEGMTKFHMADRLAEAELVDRARFLELVRSPDRYDWTRGDIETLEGYLFPETYRFEKATSEEAVIERLTSHWQRAAEPLFERYADQMKKLEDEYGFGRHDVITMASLIERETSVDEERSIIARVFYNRLDRGMQLQTDPTCVYGEDTYDQPPTPELCRDEYNRYSTYVIEGLPPGPIANPSIPSLEAALNPSDDPEVQDYLYFVSRRDGTGRHAFTTSYADHRRAIDEYLRGN